MTGAVGEERAIEILTSGATDYVLKKNLSRLLPAVHRALHESYESRKRRETEAERDTILRELEQRIEKRTAQFQTELAERKHAEYLLETALKTSNTGIWVLSLETGAMRISPQLNILFGRPADSPVMNREDFYSQIHPEDIHRVETAWKEAIERKEYYNQEYRVVWPDGSICWLASKGDVIKEPEGDLQFIGVTYDITDKKRAEEAKNRQIEFENIISGILSRFAMCKAAEMDEEITASLKEIGLFLELDSVFVILASRESRTWSSAYNWTASGAPYLAQKYQHVPFGTNPWTEKALLQAGYIQVDSLNELPPEASAERREWELEGLKSILLVPLRGREGSISGSAGFRSYSRQIQWTREDIRSLRLLSDAIANILERKRAEVAMLESEEKYRLIFESSLNGIFLANPDGTIISANPSAQKMLDMTEDEIIRGGRNKVADMSGTRMKNAIEERLRTGRFIGEVNFKKKDGSVFPVEVFSVAFRSTGGRALASVIFQDITWRKKAERILKESENRFRELADAMPQLIWTATPDGLVDYFNLRHEEFRCLIRQDSGLWEWSGCIHSDDLQATMKFGRRIVESGVADKVEHRLQDKHGVYRWYLTRGVPVRDEQGRLTKWIGTTTDINDLKEAEMALKERTQSLEEINKELESFSYSVSHDLRAPLRAIEGFSRMLLDNAQEFGPEANRKIQVIRDNAARMDRLISDLLDLSRTGRAHISKKIIDIDRVVNAIWQEQASANPGRKLDLTKGKLPKAFGDESLIRQVFSNLLANAVKFTRRNKTAVIEIEGEIEGTEAIYCIKDNGAGFDMKYYDKLFGVFQRFHPESEYEGTGVGLAIVQRIVHRHGGRVWAKGKVGKGAAFYFSLPAADSSEGSSD